MKMDVENIVTKLVVKTSLICSEIFVWIGINKILNQYRFVCFLLCFCYCFCFDFLLFIFLFFYFFWGGEVWVIFFHQFLLQPVLVSFKICVWYRLWNGNIELFGRPTDIGVHPILPYPTAANPNPPFLLGLHWTIYNSHAHTLRYPSSIFTLLQTQIFTFMRHFAKACEVCWVVICTNAQWSGQVRSGQVRVFNIQSKLL